VRAVTALLACHDLAVGYGGAPVLAGVTFAAAEGERIAVLGPNGGGKSTLFRALLGDATITGGTVERSGRCAIVPQSDRSRLDFPVSALDVAIMGSLGELPWWRRPGRRERRRAAEALAAVGLDGHARRTFGELSGGQRQRVLIARALVQDAPVLLLDEPFTGVDQANTEALEVLIDDLARAGRAVLIATHDMAQACRWDRVLCLNHRQIAFGPPEVLTTTVVEATYGGAIVSLPGDGGARGILPAHHHDHG
jgi:ABC-type Mn2+/Zn2+ transport system ATPase subunit